MKNFTSKFLVVLIMFCMIFSFSSRKVAAADSDKFDVKIDVGFNDNYKIGFSTPVNITIKNKFEDINGEVEIQVPSSPGKYMSYVKPISLQKDAEKVITINVPVGNNRTKYTLNIYNGKSKVYEDSITTMASNNITTFIGILSDDFDSLSYINTVPESPGVSLVTKGIKLDDKNFPDDIFTLNAFNIIVINDYETSRLTKLQYDILKQWVTNGGTLIIGTGSKYNKTLSIFKDDFIEGTQGSVKEIATSKIYDLATNGDNKNAAKVDTLALNIKGSNVLMEDKNVILAQSLKKGKGVVGILAFDLGQAPFANWNNNTAFMEKLLAIINPEMIASNINNYDYLQNNSYMVRNAMNQFSEMAAAKTSSFYIILFIYIFVVAPLSYFILKKMDKRELMWVTVPAFAIIFGMMVYFSGSGTRLSEITTNMVSFLNIDEKGNATTDTYAGIFNSNKMKINIVGSKGEKILPLSENYYNGNPNQTVDSEVMEAKIFAVPDGGVEYKNTSLLETKVLQIQENSKKIGKLETNISLKSGSMVGEIKNLTNLELSDCLIIMPSGYYKIDSLKSGESAKLDGMTKQSYNNGNIHQMIQDVFFQYNSNTSKMNDNERKKFLDKRQEGSILQMLYNNGNGQVEGIKLIAFSKTQIHEPLIINGLQAKKYERNIIFMPININFINGDTIDYPLGFVPFDISSNSTLKYDQYNKMFFGNGSAELLFNIDKNMKVDEIEINTSSLQFKATPQSPSFNIFNVEKNAYEPLNINIISGDNLKKYLSQDNIVKIKLEVNDTEGIVPQLAARGRIKG